MPNHVLHTMVIKGTKEELDAFIQKLDPKPYENEPDKLEYDLFNAFKPMPEEYRNTSSGYGADGEYKYPELVAKYGYNDWYDWAIGNWGTKWGTYDTNLVRHDGAIVLEFTTAWSFCWEFFKEHLAPWKFVVRANEEGTEALFEGDNDDWKIVGYNQMTRFLNAWMRKNGKDPEGYEKWEKSILWTKAIVEESGILNE